MVVSCVLLHSFYIQSFSTFVLFLHLSPSQVGYIRSFRLCRASLVAAFHSFTILRDYKTRSRSPQVHRFVSSLLTPAATVFTTSLQQSFLLSFITNRLGLVLFFAKPFLRFQSPGASPSLEFISRRNISIDLALSPSLILALFTPIRTKP
ncbi:hypothetical protein F4677DRAFT_53110 [Hypoxylon crocopeplum]|nr:hypothetical protein F4677DRAFT_53110 [Hypoxylon crocopeplum]